MNSIIARTPKNIYTELLLRWGVVSLICFTLAFVYYDALSLMVLRWDSPEYTHGFLMPFISGYLIWNKRNDLKAEQIKWSWLGFGFILFGNFLYFLGEMSTLLVLVQYSFLITVFGILWAFLGGAIFKKIFVPLLFLLYMVPLPNFLYFGLSSELQLVSSKIGVAIIRIFDISVNLEGNVIDLGDFKMQVVEACAGLKYLFALSSLGFFIAYIFKGPLWKKMIIFLSAIPITVLMNSIRIGITGILVEYGNESTVDGFLHTFQGMVIFLLALLVLLLVVFILTKIGKDKSGFLEALTYERTNSGSKKTNQFRLGGAKNLFKPQLLVFGVVLVMLFGDLYTSYRKEISPARKLLVNFPDEFSGWKGKRRVLEAHYLDVLKLDDYINSNYLDEGRNEVSFLVTYYKSQRRGESSHSPRACLPAGGWVVKNMNKIMIPIKGNSKFIAVNRAVIKKGVVTWVVYYWFKQRERHITNEYLVKWYLFLDALIRNRTDGATIRLTTRVKPGETVEMSDKRLVKFTSDVMPYLGQYVPD